MSHLSKNDKFVRMIFKDKKRQLELEENGFVVIPFLSLEELRELCQFYNKIHKHQDPPNFIENIHMTTWCSDADYKRNVSVGLSTVFKEASNRFFENSRKLNHVFIVKKNSADSTFKVHQDWNVVDETKYQSVNVWVPLHDVEENSGALWVLRGSHKINRSIRGAGYLFPDYSKYTNELEKTAVSVKLKAGEAIVFFHSVIHGSPPNMAKRNREAACFTVIPKEAPLRIYYQPEKDLPLEVHEPSDDFMFSYKELRKEAHITSPTIKANHILASYINKPVQLNELNVFLKQKKRFLNFFQR